MPKTDDVKQRMIGEGLLYYVDAMVALRQFRRKAQSECESIVRRQLPELARSIGAKLDPEKLSPYANPDSPNKGQWDGTWAWLAVKLPISDLGTLYAGLLWAAVSEDDGRVKPGAAASIDVGDRDRFNILWKVFKPLGGSRVYNWHHTEITFWEPLILDDDLQGFPAKKLNAMLGEWIRLWTRVGGVKSVFK